MNNAEAKKESRRVFEWWMEQCDRIEQEAKQNGTWAHGGLDENRHLFKALDAEAKRRLEHIKSQIDT